MVSGEKKLGLMEYSTPAYVRLGLPQVDLDPC